MSMYGHHMRCHQVRHFALTNVMKQYFGPSHYLFQCIVRGSLAVSNCFRECFDLLLCFALMAGGFALFLALADSEHAAPVPGLLYGTAVNV